MELNDAGTLAHRDHSGREFADMIVDQFEEMLEQSERHPLVFALALHGFIVGKPFRLRPLRQAIKHCVDHRKKDQVWFTRAADIAKYCISHGRGFAQGEIVCELRRSVRHLWSGELDMSVPAYATTRTVAAVSLRRGPQ